MFNREKYMAEGMEPMRSEETLPVALTTAPDAQYSAVESSGQRQTMASFPCSARSARAQTRSEMAFKRAAGPRNTGIQN
jgi:hypothetical protein